MSAGPSGPATRSPAAIRSPRYPRADSNRCFRLRRPALYPLSYGGERSERPCSGANPNLAHVTPDRVQRDKELSLMQHLGELRDRLMIATIAVVITTVVGFFFAKQIILALEAPAHLGKPLQIISPT